MVAVCIRCGNIKHRGPTARCKNCGFQPKEVIDAARSLILSLEYEIDGEYRGRTKEELYVIANRIALGEQYQFDEAEVRSVIEYAERALSISAQELCRDLLRWLVPPLSILAFALYFLVSRKS